MKNEILEMLLKINPYEEITENTLLLEEGIIDSLALLLLIAEIEKKYDIKIPFDELQIEDFETIDKIEQLIKEKQK